jgi:hypothetical protein
MKPTILFLTLAALAATSCNNESKTGTAPDKKADPVPAAFAALLLPDAPAEAISITEARKDPSPGKEVTVSGDIIGRVDVFVPNRAMLILGDPEVITSCNRMAADGCATPWDVCCDDKIAIKNSIATVQVLDADGQLVKTGLKGLGNMKELSSLVIRGTIAEGSGPDNLIINATGIHIASVEANNTPPVDL